MQGLKLFHISKGAPGYHSALHNLGQQGERKLRQIAKFMGPTCVLSAADGAHVDPMNLAIRGVVVQWPVVVKVGQASYCTHYISGYKKSLTLECNLIATGMAGEKYLPFSRSRFEIAPCHEKYLEHNFHISIIQLHASPFKTQLPFLNERKKELMKTWIRT